MQPSSVRCWLRAALARAKPSRHRCLPGSGALEAIGIGFAREHRLDHRDFLGPDRLDLLGQPAAADRGTVGEYNVGLRNRRNGVRSLT